MIIDPVIPLSLDGLSAEMVVLGRPVKFIYAIKENSFGPGAILINGKPAEFTEEENKYRRGGAVIPTGHFLAMLNKQVNSIEIQL